MINILSYVGMSLQCELCFWTIIGLLTTIFDATLFKVDSNLKQVWQMEMPAELSMSMQRFLRTMISGVMLVQCFTLYVYLATYIVLLYPIFLEEKPALVLPWLLLAAVRKLLCELMSLALGLGVCVLLGAARTPCIRFLLLKTLSITPSLYLWMQVLNYYLSLKVAATTYKSFIKISASRDTNYGLEMAVRRRRTKSLQGEEDLRQKLIAKFYTESPSEPVMISNESEPHTNVTSVTDMTKEEEGIIKHCSIITSPSASLNKIIAEDNDEIDFTGGDWNIPRDADRILEQIVLMMLKIGASLNQDIDPVSLVPESIMPKSNPLNQRNLDCAALSDEVITPPIEVGNVRGSRASYITEYPQIFMKRSTERTLSLSSSELFPRTMQAQIESQTQTKRELKGTHNKHKWRTQPSSPPSNGYTSMVKEAKNQIENNNHIDFKYEIPVIESEITQQETSLMTNESLRNPLSLKEMLENYIEKLETHPNSRSDINESLSSDSTYREDSISYSSSSKNTSESVESKTDEEVVQKKSVSFVKYFNNQ